MTQVGRGNVLTGVFVSKVMAGFHEIWEVGRLWSFGPEKRRSNFRSDLLSVTTLWCADFSLGSVSYTHLTLPTNREV